MQTSANQNKVASKEPGSGELRWTYREGNQSHPICGLMLRLKKMLCIRQAYGDVLLV